MGTYEWGCKSPNIMVLVIVILFIFPRFAAHEPPRTAELWAWGFGVWAC